ncbi:hypothetical protein LINPERPRIM_LOCUS32537 [Linum perenne]
MAEEEFGTTSAGPIQVPCEEHLMIFILSLLRKPATSTSDDHDHHDNVEETSSCNGGSSFAAIFLTLHSQFT